jgi:S1-C subfamily serine protease
MFRIIFLAVFALAALPPNVSAQSSIIDEIQKLQPAIVGIKAVNTDIYASKPQIAGINPQTGKLVIMRKAGGAKYDRYGAGVIIHPSGIIVTNAHTMVNADGIKVILHDETELPAQVLLAVKDLDFGLLKIDLPYPVDPVALGDSNDVQLRDEVITVGNSSFLKQTISGGKVKSLGTSRSNKIEGAPRANDLIHTTINMYEGDSGGPLFNKKGALIGLVTAKEVASDHSSFAIPINQVKFYLDEYLSRPQ